MLKTLTLKCPVKKNHVATAHGDKKFILTYTLYQRCTVLHNLEDTCSSDVFALTGKSAPATFTVVVPSINTFISTPRGGAYLYFYSYTLFGLGLDRLRRKKELAKLHKDSSPQNVFYLRLHLCARFNLGIYYTSIAEHALVSLFNDCIIKTKSHVLTVIIIESGASLLATHHQTRVGLGRALINVISIRDRGTPGRAPGRIHLPPSTFNDAVDPWVHLRVNNNTVIEYPRLGRGNDLAC